MVRFSDLKIWNGLSWTDFVEKYRDPRTDSYPLANSPIPTLLICLCYVLLVKVIGPSYMSSRKPFKLQKTLIVYNALQVIFSAWLFYEWGMSGWFGTYSYRCQPVDYSHSELALRMVRVSYWYYISKFTEFFDTFFFVLRKKNNHISLLHVIHHGCMPMSVWFGVRFTPGGHSTFFGFLNTFVHIVMYTYYMLAAMGPEYAKYIWWKKYLTSFQIVQFILIAAHSFQLLFIDCAFPKAFVFWIGGHGLLFLVLFANFYVKSYDSKAGKGAAVGRALRKSIPCQNHCSDESMSQKKSSICSNSSSSLDGNMNRMEKID